MLADRRALGHRRDHGRAEVLRVRAREADPLDARRRRRRRGAAPRIELPTSRPQELTFWPSSVSSLTPARARPSTSARISPGRRETSRPRTAGTMQYEQIELQPIEICTQAWKRRSRWSGSRAGEGALLGDPERTARDALAARAEPVAEVRDRAGPERDVDVRVEREETLALRLGVAAADGDHLLRVALLQRAGLREVCGEALVRLLADRARVEDEHVGLAPAHAPRRGRAPRACP